LGQLDLLDLVVLKVQEDLEDQAYLMLQLLQELLLLVMVLQ
jgi:hypothetical protein